MFLSKIVAFLLLSHANSVTNDYVNCGLSGICTKTKFSAARFNNAMQNWQKDQKTKNSKNELQSYKSIYFDGANNLLAFYPRI